MAASVSRTRQVCWGLTILSLSKPLRRHFKWAEGQSNNRGGLIIKAWMNLCDLTLENVLQVKLFSNHIKNRNPNYFTLRIKKKKFKYQTRSSDCKVTGLGLWLLSVSLKKHNLNASMVTSCCVWVQWTAISCFMQNHTFAIQMCTVHGLSVMLSASQLFP